MTRAAADPVGARLRRWVLSQWYRPERGAWVVFTSPVAALYGWLSQRRRRHDEQAALQRMQPPVPVLVVGNLVAGGAGKTPLTMALVQALQQDGWRPGVVSRGYGRRGHEPMPVEPDTAPDRSGDEPLLIRRRAGVPVWVGRDRVASAIALLQARPEVDVIVCDDGLQHRQLRRDVECWVFDERGVGNGALIPSGPLREPLPVRCPPQALVIYNHARASTPLPGPCAGRRVAGVWRLDDWLGGRPAVASGLDDLHGLPLVAMAGIAVPERFFDMLRDAGLAVTALPLDDHHAYVEAPWPDGTTHVVTTEKDAVKLARWRHGGPTIWVVGLDLTLPPDFVSEVLARLRSSAPPRHPSPSLETPP